MSVILSISLNDEFNFPSHVMYVGLSCGSLIGKKRPFSFNVSSPVSMSVLNIFSGPAIIGLACMSSIDATFSMRTTSSCTRFFMFAKSSVMLFTTNTNGYGTPVSTGDDEKTGD